MSESKDSPASSSASDDLGRLRAFSRSLPMALLKAREEVMAGFRPNLRAHSLTEQQWRALKALAQHDEMRAGQLARASLISMPSLTRILRTLEAQGLIRRRAEERDQRAALLSLTPAGHALVVAVSSGAELRYDQIAQAFGAERLEQLHLLLDELSRSLGK
ncbi:homoprotocatechuate degradation operon regulator HpaR [Paramagnetospirillum marisnigri]|uniref:homoprotocatechuate degradation operon regulator HpaR n=1 Tax=Paramagnetospirillum marisnigri TaxID=1285242 RepID=UPI000838C2F6|nr:homoprotocatechuate degradation operon regulator HpaR [Paramagnetospirillum marisnigri]